MTEWGRVKWTEASQILEILRTPRTEWAAAGEASPAAYFGALRQRGRRADAARFLGQALPRLEAVAWAARAVRDCRGDLAPPPAEERALRATFFWLQDSSEARRRTTREAAETCDRRSAERLVAMAAFFSGGSIAPPECQPVPAPREAAGKFAAGAVLVAAASTPNIDLALDASLDAGAALAASGLDQHPR